MPIRYAANNDRYRWSARRARCPYRDRVDQLNHRQHPPLPSPVCEHCLIIAASGNFCA